MPNRGASASLLLLLSPPKDVASAVTAAAPPAPEALLLNGAAFYAQLQLSFVCLTRMAAVSHSLANSVRRPATIAAALLFSPAPLSALNWAGVAIACAGALLYGLL